MINNSTQPDNSIADTARRKKPEKQPEKRIPHNIAPQKNAIYPRDVYMFKKGILVLYVSPKIPKTIITAKKYSILIL